jgi:hypothetical protein
VAVDSKFVADLLRARAMTSLARRALLRFPRPSQTLYRTVNFPRQRFLTTSYIPRQAVEENAQPEEIESLNDAPIFLEDDTTQVDWSRSFHGLSTQPFSEEAAKVLTAPLEINDVEIKPGSRSTLPRLMVRWHIVLAGDKVSSYSESCVWTGRMGSCAEE